MVVEGFDALVGLAGGLILGALIMYYLLKDGTQPPALGRRADRPVRSATRSTTSSASACRILRDYGRGRTAMSAIVAAVVGIASLLLGLPLVFTIVVVNFIGGYIPYIGAFIGGGLAVIIALGEGGLGTATIMLVVVLASNLLLENFVEPRVMGRTLDIHPAGRTRRHRAGRLPGRHRRPHPGRAVHGDRGQRHRTPAGEGSSGS